MKPKLLLPILYEDEYMFAVAKPPRMLSVPSQSVPLHRTALGMVQKHYSTPEYMPYLLHRLDSHTSGVLMFGKHERDRSALEGILGDSQTHKKYVALVIGSPNGGVISKPLKARMSNEMIPAETHYRVLNVFRGKLHPTCAFVSAEIKTGRKHQIRQHFAMIRHPVIMDDMYGDKQFNRKFRIHYRIGRLFLHAASSTFFHPILKKTIKIEAPLPKDLQSVLKKLEVM